jgi:hypothetical protein
MAEMPTSPRIHDFVKIKLKRDVFAVVLVLNSELLIIANYAKTEREQAGN